MNYISGAFPLGNFKYENFSNVSTIINGKNYNLCGSNLIEYYGVRDKYNLTATPKVTNCSGFSISK